MYTKKKLTSLMLTTLMAMAAVGIPLSSTVASPSANGFMGRMAAQDAGPTARATLITVSIYFTVTNLQGLEAYVQSTLTPSDPNYHNFLTVGQFRQRFAPSNQSIQSYAKYLKSFGITVDTIYPDNLVMTVTGTADQLNAAFSADLHDFTSDGKQFHKPMHNPSIPAAFTSLVLGVGGLNSETGLFHPMHVQLGQGAFIGQTPPAVSWPQNGTATGIPGDYTVGDVANFYQVNPLYGANINGQGQTVGIMTLANFIPADAEAYWQDIGLKVKPNRISIIPVDGGTPVAAGVGDDETSLDVEQSGGLAPQAKIRVYVAPNTDSGFMDLFYTAVSENMADTVSISWGQAEVFYFPELEGGVDYTWELENIHQALLEGASQGQSIFAASGDAGAYDVNRFLPYPTFSKMLSVDSPGDDPMLTAAGGTTRPVSLNFGSLGTVNIPTEQVWGWDYLTPICAALGYDPYGCGIFPVGGGGGVSSFFSIPYYQQSVSGMQKTEPGQSLIYIPAGFDYLDLPANFAGRNLPDISLNADPYTGYILVDCTDFPGGDCAAAGFGGTSFVAPQLNGMTALIDQASHSRVGLLNPVVYTLQQLFGYGSFKSFNDINAGDDWFYSGIPGYDDGAGIGTLNVTNLSNNYIYLNFLHHGH